MLKESWPFPWTWETLPSSTKKLGFYEDFLKKYIKLVILLRAYVELLAETHWRRTTSGSFIPNSGGKQVPNLTSWGRKRPKRAEELHYWGMLWVNCVPTLLTSMLSKRHRFHPLIMPTPVLTDRNCTNESQRLRNEELIHATSFGFKLVVKMAHFQFWHHWHHPVILFKWVTEFPLVWHIVPYAPNTNNNTPLK